MEEIVKHINDTNASYRNINAGDAKNTDLFLDNEHYSFFEGYGEEITVRFKKRILLKQFCLLLQFCQESLTNQQSINKYHTPKNLSWSNYLF